MSNIHDVAIGDKQIRLEFNKYAKLAKGAVMVTCGETQVLAVVTAADEPKEGLDFLPLTVDYIEKFYAAGRIPSNFFRREGMLSQQEALISRQIDRSIRPCFPKNYRCETFVTCTVMSVDPAHHPAPLALLGASAAIMVSDLPFNGPVAALRIGMNESGFVIDPSPKTQSRLDLNISATPDSVVMIEAGADFIGDDEMLAAIAFAREAMVPLFTAQLEQQALAKRERRVVAESAPIPAAAMQVADGKLSSTIAAFATGGKQSRVKALKKVESEVIDEYLQAFPDGDPKVASAAFHKVKQAYLRKLILDEGKRVDSRLPGDIRQLDCEKSVLGKPHGSALFQRGETQALATVTLGVEYDEQRLDSVVTGSTSKRFMLHYNFPPFSVGEARGLRSIGRREIGHGALAERAVERAMPPADKFNYTVRVVSEVLEADGSSSMATVCASSMALLDAGVPLREMIAGVAMGLVIDGDKYKILSDINDEEDHLGDMDFKVCGGLSGITAVQMDNKVGGLSEKVLAEALAQAKAGRAHILSRMAATISAPEKLKESAPRVVSLKIKPDKIRDLIGPGGKMIRSIQEKCEVRVTVEDDGTVTIAASDGVAAEKAEAMVKGAVTDPNPGDVYTGTVVRIMDFGAFIEIKPGMDGLCHISELAHQRVGAVEDVVRVGDEVKVKVLEVDRQGKIRLSRKEMLER